MKPSERTAQTIVEALLVGARMVFSSEQSNSEPDFTLVFQEGTEAALEVTEAVDAEAIQTSAAILGPRGGGPRVKAHRCRKTWYVRPSTGARINRVRAAIDDALAQLEASGIERFFSSRDRHTHPTIEYLYTSLGVASGEVLDVLDAGFVHLALPITGGAVRAQDVNDAVELEAWKSDNRSKLAASGREQRHLFVFVDVLNGQVWLPLTHFAPPEAPPDLPPEITHAWIVGPSGKDDTYVVWHAPRGSTWTVMNSVACEARADDHAV